MRVFIAPPPQIVQIKRTIFMQTGDPANKLLNRGWLRGRLGASFFGSSGGRKTVPRRWIFRSARERGNKNEKQFSRARQFTYIMWNGPPLKKGTELLVTLVLKNSK